MKSQQYKFLGLIIALFYSFSLGEVIVAESNTFTFPPITAVQTKKVLKQQGYFKTLGVNLKSGTIIFSWLVPQSGSKEREGIITIYSLSGKVVKKLLIYKHSGTIEWKIKEENYRNGMYIVNFKYDTFNKNLKLMLWK